MLLYGFIELSPIFYLLVGNSCEFAESFMGLFCLRSAVFGFAEQFGCDELQLFGSECISDVEIG